MKKSNPKIFQLHTTIMKKVVIILPLLINPRARHGSPFRRNNMLKSIIVDVMDAVEDNTSVKTKTVAAVGLSYFASAAFSAGIVNKSVPAAITGLVLSGVTGVLLAMAESQYNAERIGAMLTEENESVDSTNETPELVNDVEPTAPAETTDVETADSIVTTEEPKTSA